MSAAPTKAPWIVYRCKVGENTGKPLGVGEKNGSLILDCFGGVWRSGGEKVANKAVLELVRAEYDAAMSAENSASREIADAAFSAAAAASVAKLTPPLSPRVLLNRAAPDLLAALATLLDLWANGSTSDKDNDDRIEAQARAAIAKATQP